MGEVVLDKIYKVVHEKLTNHKSNNGERNSKMCLRTTWQANRHRSGNSWPGFNQREIDAVTGPCFLILHVPAFALLFAYSESDYYRIAIGIGTQSSSSTYLSFQTNTSPYLPHVHLPNRQNHPIYACLHF